MSKLRARQYASGTWAAYIGRNGVVESAISGSLDQAITRLHAHIKARETEAAICVSHLDRTSRSLSTWRSIAIIQFVVIVATGANMLMGGGVI